MFDDYFCENCSNHFDNGFEYVDHFIEEGETDEEFDPYLLLPNGIKLQIGSLLRFMYDNAKNFKEIKKITESTYVTLFASENNMSGIESMIKEMVVSYEMLRFDDSLKALLEKEIED